MLTAWPVESLIAGLATGLGALPILGLRKLPERGYRLLLGLVAGVMLVAAAMLIVHAIALGAMVAAIYGALAGMGLMVGADVLADRIPFLRPLLASPRWRQAALVVAAVTLHNVPEGMAVGFGYGSGDAALGAAVALGIGLQNIPEGLAIAAPLVQAGASPWLALLMALASGLVEPLGALVGVSLAALGTPMLAGGLGFAAGAMLFVTLFELIPESRQAGHARPAMTGLSLGLLVMVAIGGLVG